MAIVIATPNPRGLLANIKRAIDEEKVKTWSYDKDGDLTHAPDQWANKAWLRPVIGQGTLMFGLLGRKSEGMTKLIYGIYHGRFVEMLLTHFDEEFTNALVTAQKEAGVDDFK
ncbi:hypothetical protein [Polyangium sp. 6x1]|uniref:hypothetical protein n=1 Tax=Polyangium sp. 6x1 TaxID=3042689 RepID=UPI00248299AA|nr:hypothetical protein [Polyangium sp. 6x1]MDI1451389.1 hypothetical protein [Polyangium sp. 6x1]